jgi:preprotein translocase subunit SecD
MRRFFAYLAICLTAILGMAFNFFPVVSQTVPNFDYDSGREFTYRIENKDTDNDSAISIETMDSIVETMESRLDTYGVSKYQIAREGSDIVRVTVKQESSTEYTRLGAYLNYDADFTVTLGDPDKSTALVGDDIFTSAHIEYEGQVPVVVIDLKDSEAISEFKAVVDEATQIQEDEGSTTAEGASETTLVDNATIVIWSNYDETKDDYITAKSGDDEDMQSKLFMTFDPRHVFYDKASVDNGAIAMSMSLGDADESGNYTLANITKANNNAKYLVNIFNSTSYGDFTIDYLFSNTVDASVEYLFSYDGILHLNFSRTLVSLMVGALLVTLILAAFERVPTVGIVSLSLLSVFLSLAFYNKVGIELSTSTLIGFIIVFALAIFTFISHINAFKNEIYRGRTMKKANSEGSKKSTMIAVDASIALFIIGFVTYFLGGAALLGLSTFTMFGAVINIVAILPLTKALMWLLTNNTATQKAFGWFGINQKRIPQSGAIAKEDSYEGYFAKFNFGKKSKSVLIGSGAIAVASLGLLLGLGFGSNNALNIPVSSGDMTRIYLTVNSDTSPISTVSTSDSPKDIIERIYVDGEQLTYSSLDVEEKSTTEGEGTDKITVNYTYYILNISGSFNDETIVTYQKVDDTMSVSMALKDALLDVVAESDSAAKVSVNPVAVSTGSPNVLLVAFTTLIAWLAVTIYYMLRYGLSRGLSFLVSSSIVSLIGIGLFIITRISVTPLVAVALELGLIFASFVAAYMFNQEKQVHKDFLQLTRSEVAFKGVNMSATPILLFTLLAGLFALNYFALCPMNVALVFAALLIAILLAPTILLHASPALENFFYKIIKRISLPKHQSKKTITKKNIQHRNSAEPEEAIIIGIND